MLIKLTNSNSKRPVVMNPQNVHSMYEIIDKNTGEPITKVHFNENSYIIVTERLETIYNIHWANSKQIDLDWEVQPIDEHMENSFVPRPRYPQRAPRNDYRENNRGRNYNTYDTFNQNSY
jgi:hypothetical protein